MEQYLKSTIGSLVTMSTQMCGSTFLQLLSTLINEKTLPLRAMLRTPVEQDYSMEWLKADATKSYNNIDMRMLTVRRAVKYK